MVILTGCGRIGFGKGDGTGDCDRLPIIFRDFLDAHPDFGFTSAIVDPNIVEPALGAERVPVFDETRPHPSVTSALTFSDWYRDVPANKRVNGELERTGDSYGSPAFYPLDGAGFATDQIAHNYLFTAVIRGRFVVEPGQSLTVTSDDDAWMFINGRLVIDLGGVHGATPATVAINDLGFAAGASVDVDLFYAERGPVLASLVLDLGSIGCLEGRR